MKCLNLEAICQRRTDNTMSKIKRKTPHRKLKIEQHEPPEKQDDHRCSRQVCVSYSTNGTSHATLVSLYRFTCTEILLICLGFQSFHIERHLMKVSSAMRWYRLFLFDDEIPEETNTTRTKHSMGRQIKTSNSRKSHDMSSKLLDRYHDI